MPRFAVRPLPSVLLAAAAALLTGCGVIPSQLAPPTATHAQPLQGRVQGGQQPVAGAHIYLFAANTTGYASPSLSLLDPTQPNTATDALGTYLLTDPNGAFHLAGYTCTPGQQVYLLATGGNPGLGSGASNPALAMMTILGACPDGQTNFTGAISFLYVNEVTTIASVYALSGFMADPTHVGSSPTPPALQGIANAFRAVANLVDTSTGTARIESEQGNGDVPQAKINTLADLLVACINSTGATSACSTLFTNAPGPTGATPTETVTAALNIAHSPAANVAALFALVGNTPPFQPTLTAAPNDWTLALTYFADNMVGPYFPAFDSAGNLWVPGYTSNSLTEFDSNGNLLSGQYGFSGGGLNLPYSVTVDADDNPWVVNFGPVGSSSLSKFNNNGTPVTGTPYPCAATCFFLATDTARNLWISSTTRTIVLDSSAAPLAQFTTTAYNSGIAIDRTGHGWTIGQGRNLYQLTLPGTVAPHAESVTATSGNELTPVAIDSADNIWFVSNRNNAIGKSDKTGAPISPAGGYTGGGLNGPAGIAIDGANRVWVANRDGNTLSAFTNAGVPISPATGYKADGLSGPRGIAIDASGNVWLTNFTYNSVTEFLGIATPTLTPLTPTNHGQRP